VRWVEWETEGSGVKRPDLLRWVTPADIECNTLYLGEISFGEISF
jgi:hypothetical protein